MLADGLRMDPRGIYLAVGNMVRIPLMNLGGIGIGMSGANSQRDGIGGGFGTLVMEPGIRQWLYF